LKIPSSTRRATGLRSLALSTAIASLAMPTMAGDHWLSRVHVYDQTGAVKTLASPTDAEATSFTQSANAVFDIVISLQSDPQGDDDSTVDAGASDDEQNAYEERIKEFANAVFESTNGAHKIGRVTVYRDYKQWSLADVVWETDCTNDPDALGGPWAHAGGFGKAGKFIHMCTNWTGSSSMATPKGSGYTLAHEWGHYAYNVYDEYADNQCEINIGTLFGLLCPAWQPRSTDTVSHSIMHNQWNAASGTVSAGYSGSSADYLEYSTPNSEPYVTPNTSALGIGRNGQERYFGESAWETLTRNPATDPRWPDLDRTQYTNLTAPTSPDWIVTGGTSGAQSELDIRWVGDQVVELMIDRSGSMGGSPIANAKTGASLLIQQLPEGQAAIGVGTFETNVAQNYPITDIPDPDTSIKSDAIAQVNAISTTGLTALYDGLIFALDEVEDFQTTTGTSREGVVYVLSDGGDNSSSATEADVIAAYQSAGIPIVAFGYGGGAPTGTLGRMASATGGLFLQSPTTVAEITAALLSANAAFSNNVLVSSGASTVAAGATETVTVPLDGSLTSATINVNWTGSDTDAALRLLDPSGADTGVAFTCSGSVSCTADVDSTVLGAGGAGDYGVEIASASGGEIEANVIVSAAPTAGTTGYEISTEITGGSAVTYPAPMTISSTVSGGMPLSGLDVEAVVTDPGGTETTVPLLDDGQDADPVADDGTYTATYHYMMPGVHSVRVQATNTGNAQTSGAGLSVAVQEDGTPQNLPVSSVPETFTRVASTTATVGSVLPDDHADDPTVPAACTNFADDNVDVPGRIDRAGDVDCFFFTPSSTSDDLVARVTGLTNGMEPVITIYGPNGNTQLLEVDLAASENDQVGTVATVPASALDAAGHVVTVTHADDTADVGGYAFSVGASLVSDRPSAESDGGDDGGDDGDDDSGGALGPWSLLVLALLALVGLRQRRMV